MRLPIRSLLAAASTLVAVFTASGPAHGQLVTTTFGPFTVTCSSAGQLCNSVFSQSVGTASNLRVQYVASSGHCSPVAAHILVDGVERAATGFLAPGQASGFFDVGPVAPGTHTVALQGEGTASGCNTGTLAAWGGTMDVMVDATVAAAAAPVPAASPPLLVLLAALLVLVAALATRRRKP
jgi:MYXO-CTERM domain-containing protein